MEISDTFRLVAVNIIAWPVIQLGWAFAGTRAAASRFKPDFWLFRIYPFEHGGDLYQRLFGVKRWKDRLPDGATWFKGGVPKARLGSSNLRALDQFIVETCRGESVHWAAFLSASVFFLWNEAWVGWIMVGYGAATNLPCIAAQRYNRARLRRARTRRARQRSNGDVHAS